MKNSALKLENLHFEIENKDSIIKFFKMLLDAGVCLDPDTPFADFENHIDGKATFAEPEAIRLDYLMNESFGYCDKNNLDLYEIALDLILNHQAAE